MKDRIAPEGMIWVCTACGKISSKDRYYSDEFHHSWDESCVMNAILVKRADCVFNGAFVKEIK